MDKDHLVQAPIQSTSGHPRPDNSMLGLTKLCISLRMESPHSPTTSCPSTPSPHDHKTFLCIYPAFPIAQLASVAALICDRDEFFSTSFHQVAADSSKVSPDLPFLFPSSKDMSGTPVLNIW